MLYPISRHRPYIMLSSCRQIWRLLLLPCLLLLTGALITPPAWAQARPSIQWMHGGHTLLNQLVVSSDGNYMATGGWDGTFKIHRLSDGLVTADGFSGIVNSIAFSPDGTRVVLCATPSIQVWDLATSTLIRSISADISPRAVAWSPDGSTFASAVGASIRVYNASDGSLISTMTGHTNFTVSIRFSPDSTKLVSGSWDNSVRIWNVATGAQLQLLSGHTNKVESVGFSSDNTTVCSGSDDGTIKIWNATTGALLFTRADNVGAVSTISLSPDGQFVAGGGVDKKLRLWRIPDGSLVKTADTGVAFLTSSFSPDGSKIYLAPETGTIQVFGGANLSPLGTLPVEHNSTIPNAVISPTLDTVATVCGDGTSKIYDYMSGVLLRTIPLGDTPHCITYSPDGSRVATGGENGNIRIWKVSTGELLNTFVNTSVAAWSILWTPLNNLIVGYQNGTITTFRIMDGANLGSFTAHTTYVLQLALSPDGTMFASGGRAEDPTIKLWRLSDSTPLGTLSGHTNSIVRIQFTGDSKKLLDASNDGTSILWKLSDSSQIQVFHHTLLSAAEMAPDGATVALAGGGHLEIVRTSDGSRLVDYTQEFAAGTYGVPSLHYSKDGRSIIYTRDDPSLLLIANPTWIPTLTSVTVSPNSVRGGQTATGTVTVTNSALGDTVVNLNSNNTAATVPTTVTIPAGATSATFPITTTPVAIGADAIITATNSVSTANTLLSVTPPVVSSLSVSPTSVKGGQNSTGTVTIGSPAPAAGIPVALDSSADTIASAPAFVTIPSGATSATFTVTTHAVSSSQSVLLSATLGGTATASLTVTPPDVTGLTLSPTSVKGTLTSTGTIAIADAAPAGGIVVNLSSSNTNAATVPASVTIASGSKTATFTITSKAVAADTSVTISGVFNSQTKTATLTVLTPVIAGITVNPTVVRSLQTATATVSIDAPAPTGGLTLPLLSTNTAAATLPASVTIPAGAKTASVTVNTSLVNTDTRLLLAATLGVNSQTAAFTVVPHLPFDFDNDGHNDLVLQGQTTNLIYLWFTNGLTILGGTTLTNQPSAAWQVLGAGDVNQDGNPDLFIQNQTTGRLGIWYLLGTMVVGGEELSLQPSPGYKVVGIGDFNGDGKSDLLFQEQTSGQMVIWTLSGATVTGSIVIPQLQLAGYQVVGVGDVNGDGKVDIIFQHQTTNRVAVWYMNGATFTGGGGLTSLVPASGWQVKGVEDLNGDGKADLIFQNQTTSQLSVWYMDGVTVIGGGNMSITPPTTYKLKGPH